MTVGWIVRLEVLLCFLSLLPSSSPPHDVDCMHTLCCLFQLAEGQDEAERKHMSVDDVSKLIEELARIH